MVLTVTILLSIRADKRDPEGAPSAAGHGHDGPPAVVDPDPEGEASGDDVVDAPTADS